MMHASAGRSPARLAPQAAGMFDSSPSLEGGQGPLASLSRIPAGGTIRRKCSACEKEDKGGMAISPQLEVGAADHPAEREADAVADKVMAGGNSSAMPGAGTAPIRAKAQGAGHGGTMPVGGAQAQAVSALGSGEAMSRSDRAFFEPRMGDNFGDVRVHKGARAEAAAASVGARAFTLGNDIVFGKGQYGTDHSSRHLMAHELAHVQQGGSAMRMAKLDIVDARQSTALQPNQRQAAASCDIGCDGTNIGTFHAMPIFYGTGLTAPLPNNSGADGIGAMLHFIRNGTAIPASNACNNCNSYQVIQVVKTNASLRSGGATSYVDNASSTTTPFYDDIGVSGKGSHTIDPRWVDGGNTVDTTVSIYDRPHRPTAYWSTALKKDMSWAAEACVTCRRAGLQGSPSPDKILGCITYGFTRKWNTSTKKHEDAVATGPGCLSTPSSHFQTTLTNDPNIGSKYWWTT